MILRGIIQGDTIKLEDRSGVADGQPVTVEIHPMAPGDGIRASAGGWGDAGPELDEWLDKVYEARRAGRSVG